MKSAIVLFAIIGLGFAAPQSRKLFHEHFDDFMDIIIEKSGHEMQSLNERYSENEEFVASMDYLRTNNFKALVYEMESLPEFRAVVDFLENDNIDIHYFLDLLNDMLEGTSKRSRQNLSGTNFASFIEDSIALFPKEELSALFDQKMAEDEVFASAINNLKSPEWDAVFSALWDSPVFTAEVDTLAANGIDIYALLHEIVAIFGQ